jgi:hypothetical protein
MKKTEEQQQAQQESWEEMMEIHDEVMPKMSEISRIRRELKAEMEALDSTQTEQMAAIDSTIARLDRADIAMMNWMGDLQQLPELRQNNDHEQIMAYIEEERGKIAAVRMDMLNAIEQGKQMQAALKDNDAQPAEQ